MFNDLPSEKQGKLELDEQYLVNLMANYIKEKEAKETKKEVLDLSEMCGDFLRTNEATAGENPIPLAVLLSAAMKYPDMPEKIYTVLGDELCDIPDGFTERPEVIQATLDNLSEKQAQKKKAKK